MIENLNILYYRSLLEYAKPLKSIVNDRNIVSISFALIWRNFERQGVHINIPGNNVILYDLISLLYRELSTLIYQKYADFPPIIIGSKWKHKTGYKGYNFELESKNNEKIILRDRKKELSISVTDENALYRNYLNVQNRNLRPIKTYRDYFKNKSDWFKVFKFVPMHFTQKIVLIAKSAWDHVEEKSCIPSVYLPNSQNGKINIKKSIPVFEDCIAYFTPNYRVCYEQLLLQKIKIDTILVCDADLASISQIVQDQMVYHFKLIVLTNASLISKLNGICSWNWKREEIDLLKRL